MRFISGADLDAFYASLAELRTLGFEGVLAGFEARKAPGAVLRSRRARLGAGEHVAKNDGDAGERLGVQVREPARYCAAHCSA